MRGGTWIILFCSTWSLLVAQRGNDSSRVVLLAFGDINLGRSVGQILLKDSVDYPFEHVRDFMRSADIVFANLESQISDQGGETQHPRDRYIFCAPPQAARSLKNAGVSVVSTANNHAYDYGMKGVWETIQGLGKESISFMGTSVDSVSSFTPVIVEAKGMRFGFLAYTQSVNRKGAWLGRISLFDEARARKEIADLRSRVDVVVTSFHGGAEYVDRPNKLTRGQMGVLADAGADIVLGHHPHVPQGIDRRNKSWILYSLGNFVFYQPQRYWTQFSFGAQFEFVRDSVSVSVEKVSLFPLRAGFQPRLMSAEEERDSLLDRLQILSTVSIVAVDSIFAVDHKSPLP